MPKKSVPCGTVPDLKASVRGESPSLHHSHTSRATRFFHTKSASFNLQQAGDGKLTLTEEKVLIESLNAKIKALEARVAVTDDLEREVAVLKR